MPILLLILYTGRLIGDVDVEKRTLSVNKTLTKAKERDYNGVVMGKIKKTFSDITKTVFDYVDCNTTYSTDRQEKTP